MFSALTITSIRQGVAYDEATAAAAFSTLERFIEFATKLLQVVQTSRVSLARPVRLARA